jgi:hypothetical protein
MRIIAECEETNKTAGTQRLKTWTKWWGIGDNGKLYYQWRCGKKIWADWTDGECPILLLLEKFSGLLNMKAFW